MPAIRYSKTYKDSKRAGKEFRIDPGSFMHRDEAIYLATGRRCALIVGRQRMSSDECPRAVPESNEVLIWGNTCSLVDTDRYDALLLADTTGDPAEEIARLHAERPMIEVLYAPHLDDAPIPRGFISWHDGDRGFAPDEMEDGILMDYLRSVLGMTLTHFVFMSANVADLSDIAYEQPERVRELVSDISDGRIGIAAEDMETSMGFTLERRSLVEMGFASGGQAAALAEKIMDVKAMEALLLYVLRHDLADFRNLHPDSHLCAADKVTSFLYERTCLPELLDAYFSGVPVEDITA